MDMEKIHSINREIQDKISDKIIVGDNDTSNKKLIELVEFAKHFNKNVIITNEDLEKISKKFKYSKDLIEDLRKNYIDNIKNNVQKALARSLAQYSIYVEFDNIKKLKEINSDLDINNEIRKNNEKIISEFDNYLTKLVHTFSTTEDIKVYISIALLNTTINPFKEHNEIISIDRPVELDTIERQIKLTEAEIRKTIEREDDIQKEHQGAQISGPSL